MAASCVSLSQPGGKSALARLASQLGGLDDNGLTGQSGQAATWTTTSEGLNEGPRDKRPAIRLGTVLVF